MSSLMKSLLRPLLAPRLQRKCCHQNGKRPPALQLEQDDFMVHQTFQVKTVEQVKFTTGLQKPIFPVMTDHPSSYAHRSCCQS